MDWTYLLTRLPRAAGMDWKSPCLFLDKLKMTVILYKYLIKLTRGLLSAGLIVPVFTSCVRDVAMDAKEDPEVAVACVLTDEPIQTLRLSYTMGASLAEAPDLPEATIDRRIIFQITSISLDLKKEDFVHLHLKAVNK